jgi:Mn2+/Fe2+ NRAMP family transporter
MATRSLNQVFQALGPGLLFAGAAIGVSHLVQSTRAGALFGLGLVGVILIANLTKYPGLRFGSQYTQATGVSLLEGYRRQGIWTLAIVALLTFGSMFTVAAAVTLVTAAIFNELILSALMPEASLQVGSIILMALVAILLKTGGFKWLDRSIKVLLSAMGLLTFTATLLVLPQLDWSSFSLSLPETALDAAGITFVVALAGWMPAPLDISIWNSIWCLAKRSETGRAATAEEDAIDFNVGFALCVILALCFLILGTVVMHQAGQAPAQGGVGMAKQILSLFTESLGAWSYPVVGASALAVMFSTTLTVLDAFPRVLVVLLDRFKRAEVEAEVARDLSKEPKYWMAFGLLIAGALVVLFFFMKSFKQLVDLATTLSFVTAPILAHFNHQAMFSSDVPAQLQPKRSMRIFSIVCQVLLGGFAIFYLWNRFSG